MNVLTVRLILIDLEAARAARDKARYGRRWVKYSRAVDRLIKMLDRIDPNTARWERKVEEARFA